MAVHSKLSRSTFSLTSSGQQTATTHETELSDVPDVEKLAPVPEGAAPNDLYQPKSLKFWLILLSNFLALFLVALDRTIVATAVPRITDEFHSLGDIGWYAAAYMLTTSAAQLLFGRVYKFYSTKWVFLWCVIWFEIGSAICGAAPSSTVFIVGRAVAGTASAGIFSGCMLIMIPMVPLHKRPMFQGLFGMVFGFASVVGPLVGGGFTNGLSWRWCFYINLPVGAFTLLFMIFFWNPPSQKYVPASAWTHFKRLDPLGTLFFLPGVVCLLLALQWGGSTYPWLSWRIIPLFALFAALMIAFAIVQIVMPDTATLPPRVVMQRSVLSGALFTFFLSAGMLMMVYFLPIWFQTVKGVDPLKSGIYTLPIMLSLVVSSLFSGIFTQKVGYYVPSAILAPTIMAVGEGLLSTFTPETGSQQWIGYQFLAGFGLGFGMQIGNLAAQTVLAPADIPTGTAIMFFVQQLGGAVFTSVGQTLLDNLMASRLAEIPGIDAKAIASVGANELVTLVPAADLPLIADAYNYACTRVFLTAMGLTFCALISSFFLEWKSIKKGMHGAPSPPGSKGVVGGPTGPAPESAGSTTKILESSESSIVTQVSSNPQPPKPTIDAKFIKAQKEAEERLRRVRRESDPAYQKQIARLGKKGKRLSVG